MRVSARQRGFSLIEVLVAVLIFSLGLIGLAGLLVMATRSNQVAYLRTQASFLAGSMADRMRANPNAVWGGAYNSSSYPVTVGQTCTLASPCTPNQVAVRDQYLWSTQLSQFLPNVAATIQCTNGTTPTATQLLVRPPYAGNCLMTISWAERAAGDSLHADVALQTYRWNFQP